MMDKTEFIRHGSQALEMVYDTLNALESVSLGSLDPDRTVLIAVDMINGFAKAGALYSPRVEALIPGIAALSQACGALGIRQVAFADAHPQDSPEFESYPAHCLAGSEESELVTELKATQRFKRFPKNSTNGFLEPEFQGWLKNHDLLDTFLVVGDCTDICILQFATTLKCHFNRINRPVRVIVPAELVDTYDLGTHPGDFMHTAALMLLMGNGVEVVRGIAHED